MNIQIALDISVNNIFLYLCFKKICVVFTPSHLYPRYVLHLSRHRDQFAYGLKKINVSFEEFKGKTLSLSVNV